MQESEVPMEEICCAVLTLHLRIYEINFKSWELPILLWSTFILEITLFNRVCTLGGAQNKRDSI